MPDFTTAMSAAGYLNPQGLIMRNMEMLENVGLWNMQNEYNHPRQVKNRLLEAGLSPQLMYAGAGASGAHGNAQAIQGAKTNALSNTSMQDIVASRQISAQTELTKEQVKTEQITQAAKLLENVDKSVRLKMLQQMFPELVQKPKLENEQIRESIKTARVERTIKKIEASQNIIRTAEEIQRIKAQTGLVEQQTLSEKVRTELLEFDAALKQFGITPNSPFYARAAAIYLNSKGLSLEQGIDKVSEAMNTINPQKSTIGQSIMGWMNPFDDMSPIEAAKNIINALKNK